jgi:cytidylate kinase
MDFPSVVAIDGPVASGKTTVGRALAQRLGYTFIDTGLMYRAVTLFALRAGVPLEDTPELSKLATNLKLRFSKWREGLTVDGNEIGEELRTAEIEGAVSLVAEVPGVRAAMLEEQRRIAEQGNVVMVGRDIGTKVLPNAAKAYLDASVEERARRRRDELMAEGVVTSAAAVRDNLESRDTRDAQRADAPLRVADGACLIDTDGLDIDSVVERLMRWLEGEAVGGTT